MAIFKILSWKNTTSLANSKWIKKKSDNERKVWCASTNVNCSIFLCNALLIRADYILIGEQEEIMMSSTNLASYESSSNAHKIQQEDRVQQADTQEVLNVTIIPEFDPYTLWRKEASTGCKQRYQHKRVDERIQLCRTFATLFKKKKRKKEKMYILYYKRKDPHYN